MAEAARTDAAGRAEAIIAGGETGVAEVGRIAEELRRDGPVAPIAPMLIAVARRALYDDRERLDRFALSLLLRDHQQFGYARRLLGRIRAEEADREDLRQQEALCTYKDMELPAARRLDRALEILVEGGPLEETTSAETLGIAGAIFKHKWELDAKRSDLESAAWCYERGYGETTDPNHNYAGVNAAFVFDQLAALEDRAPGDSTEATALRARADEIRRRVAESTEGDDGGWGDATVGEALFGLAAFDRAAEPLRRFRAGQAGQLWRLESTAMQLGAIARVRRFDSPAASAALEALVGQEEGAVLRAYSGKVGLALSGGGFRASLFHIGTLARLAECKLLRRVEVLSCVSGGSILGAYYYLKLRRLLQAKPDGEIEDADYVTLVRELAEEFLAAVRRDLRGQLTANVIDNWKMFTLRYSRTDRAAGLFERMFFAMVPNDSPGANDVWRMTDLYVRPRGREDGFSLRYENWLRQAKVPILVLNATTLNTGHNWQFTASWMGEPPTGAGEQVEASRRLRRIYYRDLPTQEPPALGKAVGASACVPALFPPVTMQGLYEGIDVELVDGGVHDNQGIASLLDQDCTVVLVSDASGQMRDAEHPKRGLLGVATRSNSILMARVRGAQYAELANLRRSEALRSLMIVHLKKGLPALPRDWVACQEPYRPEDDALAPAADGERYRIDRDVQRALAELRTDLDAFSDDEAYSLMAAGYEMTRVELAAGLGEVSAPDPELERLAAWPFADVLAKLDRPDSESGLATALRPGRARFFRWFAAWRLRRAPSTVGAGDPPEQGPLQRLAHGVGLAVVTPIRAIVGAPLALLGGLATRLVLTLRGRG
jgi:predicted acylesterase/phospholipase RssA